MNHEDFIKAWIAAGNAFDTKKYLTFYQQDAVLEDPSVGRKFEGHEGIGQYFEDYFIVYKTQTNFVKTELLEDGSTYVEVLFTGEFPEGKIGGTFELMFRDDKIESVIADLI